MDASRNMVYRRLFFYTHALVGGGAERVWARLASGLAERGHQVDFLVDFEASANLPFLSDKVRLRVLPKGHAGAVIELAHLLRKEKPDAVLSALSVSNLKLGLASFFAGRAKRSILSYHGFYENEPQLLSRIGFVLSRRLIQSTGATVAVSNSLRHHLIDFFKASAEKIATIYNPAAVEPLPQSQGASELAARAPHIVAIGRLVPDKGFETILRAFARLRNADARLTIYGEGPQRQHLEGLAAELGIAERVSLPGYSRDIYQALAHAKCFALGSVYETFSLALVEALSFGLPAVVTDSGGPPEVLGARGLGHIVPLGDIDGFARALDAALEQPGDPLLRQRRAAEFCLSPALDNYESLIDMVIERAEALERGESPVTQGS